MPEIADAPNAAQRRKMIAKLESEDPATYAAFCDARRHADGDSSLVRNTGRYPLCGRGDINTYAVFSELNRHLITPSGRVGCIVPTGIATDDTTKYFFQDLMDQQSLISLYDFENADGLFPGVHREQKFSLLSLAGSAKPARLGAAFTFFAHQPADIADAGRRFILSADDIALLNPNTRTCPIFRTGSDSSVTKTTYQRVPVLLRDASESQEEYNPWGIAFGTMFHMANHSYLFRTCQQLDQDGWRRDGNTYRKDRDLYVPLYEGKMTYQYNHRYGTFADVSVDDIRKGNVRDSATRELTDPRYSVLPRYWVPCSEVMAGSDGPTTFWLSFHRVANPNNERTALFTIIPPVGVGDSIFLITGVSAADALTSVCPWEFISF